MKRLLLSAAAAVIMAGGPAFADRYHVQKIYADHLCFAFQDATGAWWGTPASMPAYFTAVVLDAYITGQTLGFNGESSTVLCSWNPATGAGGPTPVLEYGTPALPPTPAE